MTDEFEPGPLAEVSRRPAGDRWTLTFVRELAHPVPEVWAALTAPDQLGAWAPYTADRNLAQEGPARLTMLDGSTAVPLAATVTRVEPPTLLEYSWGDDVLRWELAPTATGTRLTLRHTMRDRDWVAKVAAGWHLCLVVAEHLLDADPIPPIRGEDAKNYGWEPLADAYQKDLDGQSG
jgi:uncharacterized protein YndB with AHSA1/START domain